MPLIHEGPRLPSSTSTLLTTWVAAQPWLGGVPVSDVPVGSYRFDDPDGVVEIETYLLRADDGRLVQVPVTQRPEPLLAGSTGERGLLGTTEDPVLGVRWIYDGCADPVYFAALCTAILAGGSGSAARSAGADIPVVHVRGSGGVITDGTAVDPTAPMQRFDAGSITVLETGVLQVGVQRMVGEQAPDDGSGEHGPSLTGTWPGVTGPTLLAYFRPVRRSRP